MAQGSEAILITGLCPGSEQSHGTNGLAEEPACLAFAAVLGNNWRRVAAGFSTSREIISVPQKKAFLPRMVTERSNGKPDRL